MQYEPKYRPITTSNMSGAHLLTISKVERYRKEDGSLIIEGTGVAVVITFTENPFSLADMEKDSAIVHQEVYWLSLDKVSKLWKLLNVLDYEGMELDSKKLLGRKLWLVFRHNTKFNGEYQCEIIDMAPEEKKPKYPYQIIEYVN